MDDIRSSSIWKCLRELPRYEGVYRGDIFEALCPELRELWGVAPNETRATQAKVAGELRDLIADHAKDPIEKISVLVAFNLTEKIPTSKRKTLEDRHKYAHINLNAYSGSKTRNLLAEEESILDKIAVDLINKLDSRLKVEMGSSNQRLDSTGEPATSGAPLYGQNNSAKAPWRRRLVFDLTTALLIAALAVTILITLNDNDPHKDATGPVLIEAVSPLNTGANGSFVIPGSLKLSPSQLATFTPPTDGPHKLIPTGSGYVTVTLASNTNKPVTISNISIDKKVCTEPATGTLLFAPPAGQNSNIGIGFDLDLASPPAQEEHNSRLTGDYFRDYNITVSPNELPQTLSLYATTNKYDCTFRFQLTIATSNGTTTEYIPQNGSFTLTAIRHTTANLVGVDFSYYQAVYVTGIAAQPAVLGYIQVNPKTYQGVGNAASFPPTP